MFNKKKLLNNKGFSVIEVVLSFSLVVVVLASMVTIIINYRDKITNEEVKTQLLDFKNTITKVIYDDIVDIENVGYTSISRCSISDNDNCAVNFVKEDGTKVPLNIIVQEVSTSILERGIYFEYKDIKYFLPDSNLNDYLSGDISKYAIVVDELVFNIDNVNNLYSVKIPIIHQVLKEEMIINLVVS